MEDDLDTEPVKEIKYTLDDPLILHQYQRKPINFHSANANFIGEKLSHKSHLENYDLFWKEKDLKRTKRGQVPQVKWEEVSNSSQIIPCTKELPADILPSHAVEGHFSPNSSSMWPSEIKQDLIDESAFNFLVSNTSCNSIQDKEPEAHPSLIHPEAKRSKSKPQNYNSNTPSDITKSKENKENESHSPNHGTLHEFAQYQPQTEKSDTRQQSMMIRIHAGRIEPSYKDPIRIWKQMDSVFVQHEQVTNSVKRKSSNSSNGKETKRMNLEEDHPLHIGSKNQRFRMKDKSAPCQTNSTEDPGQSVKVRHYDRESVRNFIASQTAKRREAKRNEIKHKQEEKKRIEKHLKNLATLQYQNYSLATRTPPADKSGFSAISPESILRYKDYDTKRSQLGEIKKSDCNPLPLKVEAGVQCSTVPLQSKELGHKRDAVMSFTGDYLNVDKPSEDTTTSKPGRKRSCQKRVRCSHSDSSSSAINQIVSRALQECQEKIKGGDSTLLSGSEDIETTSDSSENGVKSIASSRKERIAALSEMAQRLAQTIDQEAAFDKTVQDLHPKLTPIKLTTKASSDVITQTCAPPTNNKPLSLAEIKAMSLEELVNRMISTLPKTNSKERLKKPRFEPPITEPGCISSCYPEPNSMSRKINGELSGRSYRHLLKPLEEPPICTKEPKSQLVKNTPLLSFRVDDFHPVKSQKLGSEFKTFYSSSEIQAATIIQAYFRGFRVRQKTSSELTARIRRKKFEKLLTINVPPLIEPPISTFLQVKSHMENPKAAFNFIKHPEDWHLLREDLERKSKVVLPPDPKETIALPLPEYVQPFFDLRETGDIEAFVASCSPNEIVRWTRNNTKSSSNSKKMSFKTKIPPKEHSNLNRSDSEIQLSLIPQPLQLLKETLVSCNKETQTVPKVNYNSDSDLNDHSTEHIGLKGEDTDEMCLKRFRNKDLTHKRHCAIQPSMLENKTLLSSLSVASDSEADPKRCKSDNDLVHSLEANNNLNGITKDISTSHSYLAETSQDDSFSVTSPFDRGFSEKFSSQSSDEFKNISLLSISPEHTSSSILVEKDEDKAISCAILPQEYQMSPATLSMRVTAELAYQDTLGSALNHLQDLENLRALSQIQEKSSNVFGAFTRTATRSSKLDEDLKKAREENDKLKQAMKEFENDRVFSYKEEVERLEREAESRILQFERDMKERAERLIDSVTKTPYRSVTAVATNTTFDEINKLSRQNVKEDKSKMTELSFLESDGASSYTQEFTELSNHQDSSQDKSTHFTLIHPEDEHVAHSETRENLENYECSSKTIQTVTSSMLKSSTMQELSGNTDLPSSAQSISELVKSPPFQEPKSVEKVSPQTSLAEVSHVTSANESILFSLPQNMKITDGFTHSSHSTIDCTENRSDVAMSSNISEEILIAPSKSEPEINSVSERLVSTDWKSSLQDDYDNAEMLTAKVSLPSHSETDANFAAIRKLGVSSSQTPSENYTLEHFASTTKGDSQTITLHTSIAEMISSFPSESYTTQALSLVSQCSSSSSICETKNCRVMHATGPEVHSAVIRSVVDTSGTYSESFEPDSGTSDTSEPSLIHSKLQKTIIEIDTVSQQNTSISETSKKADVLDSFSSVTASQADTPKSTKGGALFSTLTLLESLQKEEEIRLRHQMAVFKLHEQSLVEEARMKLAALNSDGGTNVRKKQRAILLQLREQRTHIRRLIETQNLAAQQRHLIFWQHHQLLSSTTNPSSLASNRILPSRVQSPITTRILDLSLSSSDGLESASNIPALPLKSFTKSSVDTLSGDEPKIQPNKLPEERPGKWDEGGRESKILDVHPSSLRDREKVRKDEKTTRLKERYLKLAMPSVKTGKKTHKAMCEDKPGVDEDQCDIKKASLTSNEGSSSHTPEKSLIFSIPIQETASSEDEQDSNKSLIKISTSHNSPSEPETEINRSNKHPNEEKDSLSLNVTESHNFNLPPGEKSRLNNKSIICLKQNPIINKSIEPISNGISGVPFALKFPLSPRSRLRQHRRQSSESDDSFTLSQNETASDMSDGEGKLVALREELAIRKAEADRLKKEKRKIHRERVSSQELALKHQIAAYDKYIKQTKSDIEKEINVLQGTGIVKPLIKKPQVAGSKRLQVEQVSLLDHSELLEESSLNESSIIESFKYSDENVLSNSSVITTEVNIASDKSKSSCVESLSNESETGQRISEESSEDDQSQISKKEDSDSMKEEVCISMPIGLFMSQGGDSEATASHNSSTETIIYSPQKSVSLHEVQSSLQASSEKMEEASIKEREEKDDDGKQSLTEESHTPTRSPKTDSTDSMKAENNLVLKKNPVDIFVPCVSRDSPEVEKLSQDHKTICEEIPTDGSLSSASEMDLVIDNHSIHTPELMETQLDLACMKEKAYSVADSILTSLVNESVLWMKSLSNEKQKEVGQFIVHIEESAEADLNSGNVQIYDEVKECVVTSLQTFTPQNAHKNIADSSAKTQMGEIQIENFNVLEIENDTATEIPTLPTNNHVFKHPIQCDILTKQDESTSTMQPKMKTPSISPVENDISSLDGVDAGELSSKLMSIQTAPSPPLDQVVCDMNEPFSVSCCQGDWPEEEFWKGSDKSKSDKELRKEEELLNAEIARLEEIQRFKERYPNLVIREVPDKPPPPYTPPKGEANHSNEKVPSQLTHVSPRSGIEFPEPQTSSNTISVPHRLSKADLREIASDIISEIPSSLDEVLEMVNNYFDLIYHEWQQGKDPSTASHPTLFLTRGVYPPFGDDHYNSGNNESTFHRLLFHLTRDLVGEIYAIHSAPPKPLWIATFIPHPAKPWQVVRNLTRENLLTYVKQKTRILMGWDSPTTRESAMMKWARKKKEHIDQVLVQELQTEELSWTQYEEEEVHVKFLLSQEILSTLIEETTNLFEPIVQRKLSYQISSV